MLFNYYVFCTCKVLEQILISVINKAQRLRDQTDKEMSWCCKNTVKRVSLQFFKVGLCRWVKQCSSTTSSWRRRASMSRRTRRTGSAGGVDSAIVLASGSCCFSQSVTEVNLDKRARHLRHLKYQFKWVQLRTYELCLCKSAQDCNKFWWNWSVVWLWLCAGSWRLGCRIRSTRWWSRYLASAWFFPSEIHVCINWPIIKHIRRYIDDEDLSIRLRTIFQVLRRRNDFKNALPKKWNSADLFYQEFFFIKIDCNSTVIKTPRYDWYFLYGFEFIIWLRDLPANGHQRWRESRLSWDVHAVQKNGKIR